MLLSDDIIAILLWIAHMPWSDRIGRRFKLRDLHILLAVAQSGSMGKAANQLSMSQPVVSKAVADMEHALGVKLLDRSRRGVELTTFGRAVIRRGAAVFNELKECVKEIEFLADPTAGEINIGGNEAFIAGPLAIIFDQLRRRYPGITVHTTNLAVPAQQYRELRERNVDLIIGRIPSPIDDDVETETWFQNRLYVVAGLQSRLGRRRKIALAELANEPWALPPPASLVGTLIADAFRTSGVEFPRRGIATGSIHLLNALLAKGPYLAVFSDTILRFSPNLPPLKVLPLMLPIPPLPVGIMTLKNRTLSPVAQLFIDCAREILKPLASRPYATAASSRAAG
jgi:DNA-binding transcriptional LysR family regulator